MITAPGWRGPFRHRNYRLFWGGQLVSLAGTWMQSIAQAWLITELTPDPVWLGVVAAAQFTHICRECSVATLCLEYAIKENQDTGVWGGLSEDERKSLKRKYARARRAS
jgi:hypothetical protein